MVSHKHYHYTLTQNMSVYHTNVINAIRYFANTPISIVCFNVDVDNVVVVFLIVVADAQSFSCPASNYS